jgi:hypothetical protein
MEPLYNIEDFGAQKDADFLNTRAIQAAIDTASAGGGGTVMVPPGRFITGTITIRSFVKLELMSGARLVGSRNLGDYPAFTYTEGEVWRKKMDAMRQKRGLPPWKPADDETDSVTKAGPLRHLIIFHEAEGASLCGDGIIDGQGDAFWTEGQDPRAWTRGDLERPAAMVAVVKSRNIKIRDVTLKDSPFWNLDLYHSDFVDVTGIIIESDPRAPNDDGIDISGSHDVTIANCRISVGDDGIVLNTRPRDVRRVTVTNCIIASQCAALKVGWGNDLDWEDISQVTFSNCVLHNCNRGFAIYSAWGRTVTDVTVSNIVCETRVPVVLCRPIHIDLRLGPDPARPGVVRNIFVSNFIARSQGRILLTAGLGGVVENVTLRDVRLEYVYLEDPAVAGAAATSLQYSSETPRARVERAALVAENIRGLRLDGFEVSWPERPVPAEWQQAFLRENGGRRIFLPDFTGPVKLEFARISLRNVTDCRISPEATATYAPGLSPSEPAGEIAIGREIRAVMSMQVDSAASSASRTSLSASLTK